MRPTFPTMQEQVGYNMPAATRNEHFPAPLYQEGRFWAQLHSQFFGRDAQNRILTEI